MTSDLPNEFRSGDVETVILRKILSRMMIMVEAIQTVNPTVVIEPGDVEIGSVLIKDATAAVFASVITAAPGAGDAGLVVRNIPSGTQNISGTVAVSNFPATQPVSGSVSVANFPATQPVSGSVSVANFPATQPVSGSVSVANFPATQPVSGSVSVANFPATQPVSGAVTVSGSVSVSNFPATQPVSGTVTVSNFPATQPVSGSVTVSGSVSVSNFPATQTVSGSVSVSNFPATQPVSGSVSVSNFPATQPVSGSVTVSGSVSVSNFPATQPVSGTVAVSNFPAVQTTVDQYGLTNPIFEANRVGTVAGKAAKAYHIMARRAGFNSTSVLQDVAEFLGTAINAMPELTGVESLEVVSSSANDTVAGSGVQKIRVTYIDTSNNLVTSADISMNGTTPVALAFQSHQILWMEATAVGATTVAEGNIILRIVGPGATHEQITAGGNRSLSSHFMVPTGYTGYIVSWQTSAIGSASQDSRLRATVRSNDRALNGAFIFQDNAFVSAGGSVADEVPFLAYPALSKIKVSTITSAAAAQNRIDSDYTILLIAN